MLQHWKYLPANKAVMMHVIINAGDERQLYPYGSCMSSLGPISTIMLE